MKCARSTGGASAGGQARLTRHNAGPGLDQSGVQTKILTVVGVMEWVYLGLRLFYSSLSRLRKSLTEGRGPLLGCPLCHAKLCLGEGVASALQYIFTADAWVCVVVD
jgi:hypothetical protein